jgi:pyruvate formate lyase activating enzyme
MRIGGLQKVSLLDFPGKIAATVFLSGCNMRCPFCHNAPLVLPGGNTDPGMTEQELLDFLQTRRGKLDGVCVTGGEPTLHKDLPLLLQKIKDMGFQIKLDTNGTNPEMLSALLDREILDYVAMDIKNSPEKYSITCGGDHLETVKKSAAILMNSKVEYEFRTTVVQQLHTPEDLEKIGQWLTGAKRYYIQQFVDSGHLIGQGLSALSPAEMEILRQAALTYIPTTALRGV